jgi:hypothetical protein
MGRLHLPKPKLNNIDIEYNLSLTVEVEWNAELTLEKGGVMRS